MFESLLIKVASVIAAPFLILSSWVQMPTTIADLSERLNEAETTNQFLLEKLDDQALGTALPSGTAVFETSLASAITSSATTMTLTANTVRGGGSLSGYQCFTIDEGSAQAEFVCGTISGTTVSSLERGVSPADGITEDSDLQFAHRRGSNVKITDFPLLQRIKLQNNGEGTFESLLSYASGVTPTGNDHLTDVAYVLGVVNGGTVSFDKEIVAGNAGETVATGTPVYFDTIQGEWMETDASVAASSTQVLLGITQGAGTNGNSISGGVLLSGLDQNQSGLTPNTVYYLSDTAGALASSAGTISSAVGIAKSATDLYFLPRFQEAALAAANTFSGNNTFSGTNTFTATTTARGARIGAETVKAGATITGTTLPVPVYQNKTDNEYYAADGNATTSLKFQGFAISNGTDGNDIDVQFNGVVAGFSGLSEGEKYYVQDAVGTIGTSPGTREVLVGIAISETELLIQKGKHRMAGEGSIDGNSDNIDLGFRPSVIHIDASLSTGDESTNSSIGVASFVWTASSGLVSQHSYETGGTGANGDGNDETIRQNASNYFTIGISNVDDDGFTITQSKTSSPDNGVYTWYAEGEL